MKRTVICITVLTAALLSAPGDGSAGLASDREAARPVQASGAAVALVGATLIDGKGGPAIPSATLVIRDGRIVAAGPAGRITVPADARRIDVAGKTIMPGLVNAHGHVAATRGMRSGPELYTEENVERQLKLYAAYGVTTVFSLGDDREAGIKVRDRQRAGPTDMARLYVAGPVISGQDPDAARRATDEVAAMGVDLIKIRVDDNLGSTGKMSRPAYEAVIDQAHRRKLRVAAHLYYLDDAKALVRAGADMLAHSVRDKQVDDELIGLLKNRNVCLSPTLMREVSTFVYESRPAFFDDPFFLRQADRDAMKTLEEPARQAQTRDNKSAQAYKAALPTALRNVKRLADAGVTIAFGTDTGPVSRFQGYFEHLELEQMVEAGLTPAAAIKAATGDAARCHAVAGTVGTLEPGAWADFIVLTKNPIEAIRNSRTIESVWIGGRAIAEKTSSSITIKGA